MNFLKIILSMFIVTVHANSGHRLNVNQNFLDLGPTYEIIDRIKSEVPDEEIRNSFIERAKLASNMDELALISDEVGLYIKELDEKEGTSEESDNTSDSPLEFVDDDEVSPDQTDNPTNDKHDDDNLLVFLDDQGRPLSNSDKEEVPPQVDKKKVSIDDVDNIYILTDDSRINILEYQEVRDIKGVSNIYTDIPTLGKGDGVLIILNNNYDLIDILAIINSLPDELAGVFITTENSSIADHVELIQNYSDDIMYIKNSLLK